MSRAGYAISSGSEPKKKTGGSPDASQGGPGTSSKEIYAYDEYTHTSHSSREPGDPANCSAVSRNRTTLPSIVGQSQHSTNCTVLYEHCEFSDTQLSDADVVADPDTARVKAAKQQMSEQKSASVPLSSAPFAVTTQVSILSQLFREYMTCNLLTHLSLQSSRRCLLQPTVIVPHAHWEAYGRGSLPLHSLVSDSANPHCVSDPLPHPLWDHRSTGQP